jgi:hypothetical protein
MCLIPLLPGGEKPIPMNSRYSNTSLFYLQMSSHRRGILKLINVPNIVNNKVDCWVNSHDVEIEICSYCIQRDASCTV